MPRIGTSLCKVLTKTLPRASGLVCSELPVQNLSKVRFELALKSYNMQLQES